jgi:tetratricopeptide (TPR) repeat protein
MKTRKGVSLKILTGIGTAVILLLTMTIGSFAAGPTWNQTYLEAKKLGEQGKWAEALRTAKLALERAGVAFGADSLNAAKCDILLGDLWAQRGKFVSAQMHYLRGQNLLEKILGPNHPALIRPLTRLGDLYATHGKIDKAALTYAKVIETCDTNGRSHDPSLVGALIGTAGISRKEGNNAEAEACLNRAMALCDTYKKYDASLNVLAVRTLNDLAEIHSSRSHYSQAAECYHKALILLGSGYDADKLLTCSILTRLAEIHAKRGSTTLSRDYQKRAMALYALAKGPTATLGFNQLQP